MNRVCYHQNLFDLLGRDLPGISPAAVPLIEASEARCGRRLPASVREWYSLPGVVPLVPNEDWGYSRPTGLLWVRYSNNDHPAPLSALLNQFESGRAAHHGDHAGFVCVVTENQGCARWYLELDDPNDPPVWVDDDRNDPATWTRLKPFSAFLFSWFALFGSREWLGSLPRPHLEGLWLRAPREPALAPPQLDQLIDLLDEEPRGVRPDGPTTCSFRYGQARLRVTTDAWEDPAGHSAWWLNADTAEALEALVRRVGHVGGLPEGLRADTDAGRVILEGYRSSGLVRG